MEEKGKKEASEISIDCVDYFTINGVVLNGIFYDKIYCKINKTNLREEMHECRLRIERTKICKIKNQT